MYLTKSFVMFGWREVSFCSYNVFEIFKFTVNLFQSLRHRAIVPLYIRNWCKKLRDVVSHWTNSLPHINRWLDANLSLLQVWDHPRNLTAQFCHFCGKFWHELDFQLFCLNLTYQNKHSLTKPHNIYWTRRYIHSTCTLVSLFNLDDMFTTLFLFSSLSLIKPCNLDNTLRVRASALSRLSKQASKWVTVLTRIVSKYL